MVYEIREPAYLTLREGSDYSFSDIFKLQEGTHEVVASYGYKLHIEPLTLPTATISNSPFDEMQQQFRDKVANVVLTSETARREFYLAPILWRLHDFAQFRIYYEYAVNVRPNLRGVIDYILRTDQQAKLLVIEAKNADMERGFNQLAVEMIAMDEHEPPAGEPIYGVVSIGDLWRFGRLDRTTKRLYKDINAFHIPNDLHKLFSVLIGILM